jgi:hypothetical protein
MKAMRNGSLVFAVLLLGSVGCDSAAPVPSKPTWVDDVEPILRGACFHCHGAEKRDVVALRWDFFDAMDSRLAGLGDFSMVLQPGAHIGLWVTAMKPVGTFMPPPPASPLPDHEVQIIRNWAANVPLVRGMRNPNQKPTAEWLKKPTSILISDGDHEQVLGKMTCNGVDAPILRSGTFDLPMGWQPPCTAAMFDGQDVVTVNLP